jgi:WD40 repeat protein/serine/threonine protein kinase
MSTDAPEPLEDEFADLLAAYDDALANGAPSPASSGLRPPPPELQGRLDEALECLQALQQLWPAPPQPPMQDRAVDYRGPRYRLRRPHAAGGIGQVWLAHDANLDRDVALKEPLPHCSEDPAFQNRFRHEARITGRLQHPGIVPVYELVFDDKEQPPFYTMRFVQGHTLTEAIQVYHLKRADGSSGPLDFNGLLASFVSICNTVAYAHSQGIVHRDLKSQNVVLGEFGEVILLDWGFAHELGKPDDPADETQAAPLGTAPPHLTLPGQILGTPAYMAPEQAAGRRDLIDQRTDVYGLGAILYEICTGRPPFTGADTLEVLRLAREATPPRPEQVCTDVAPALAAVCMRALARDPVDRYPSAAELARDVQRWLADEPTMAYPESVLERLHRWSRRHKPVVAGLAALLVTTFTVVMIALVLLEKEQARTSEIQAQAATQKAADDKKAREALEGRLYCERLALAERELVANNLARVTHLLAECPPARRGWEWGCLQRLAHTDQSVLRGHQGPLTAAVFCARDERLASAGLDHLVKLWDLRTGAVLHTLKGHEDVVLCLAASPSGDRIASGSYDRTVKVWDVATGQELRTLAANGDVNRVAFTMDGRRLAALSKRAIQLWDLTSGKEIRQLKDTCNIYGLAFSPDGRHLATAGDDHLVKLWDLEAGTMVNRFQGHTSIPSRLAFSADGRQLASGDGDTLQRGPGTVKVWDLASAKRLYTLHGHTNPVYSVAFTPDGQRLVSGGADNTIKVWDMTDGQLILTLRGHTDTVRSLIFSANGQRLVSASLDRTIRIWDATPWTEEQAVGLVRTLRGQEEPIIGLGFSPNGERLCSLSYGSVLRVWNASSGENVQNRVAGLQGEFHSFSASQDGKLMALGRRDGAVKLMDAEKGTPLGVCPSFRGGPVLGVTFSNDGMRVAAAQWWHTIRIYDVKNCQSVQVLHGHTDSVVGVAYSTDDRLIASASTDQTAKIWDTQTGKVLRTLQGHTSRVICVAFDLDGRRLASAANDGCIKLWDVATGQELRELRGHTAAVSGVAFHPNGRWLVSASDDWTVKLWDLSTDQTAQTFRGHSGAVRVVTFAPGGQRLASAGHDLTVRLWQIPP